jgi:hypothetical protein
MFLNNLILSFLFLTASLTLGQTASPSQSPATTPVLPIGKAIPCRLLLTVDSTGAKVKTPVVGTVLENILEDGKVVVPAGTIATCFIEQPVAFRDRIAVEGEWHLSSPEGKSVGEFEGVVCDRDADPHNNSFGPKDGSAGLRGIPVNGEERFIRVPAGKEFYIIASSGQNARQNVFTEYEKDAPQRPASGNDVLPPSFKIPCSFVSSVDAQSQTPVLAVVTNDVWWNGKVVLPKGTRVDALKQPAVDRDRLQFKGLWVITAAKNGYFVDAQALFEDGTVGILARKNGDALQVPAGQGFYLYLESPLQLL